jgi:hypothetical protein
MNTNETLNVSSAGQLTISRADLERVLQATKPSSGSITDGQWPRETCGLPRLLAFSIAETADLLSNGLPIAEARSVEKLRRPQVQTHRENGDRAVFERDVKVCVLSLTIQHDPNRPEDVLKVDGWRR